MTIAAETIRAFTAEELTQKSDNYPIVRLYKYSDPKSAVLSGVMAKAKTITRYAIVLRTQLIPERATAGPYRDSHYKILPAGSASLSTAGILGFPVLDCPPYGLGWRISPTAHVFSALDVALPRLEMPARERYFAALAAERAPSAEPEPEYAEDGEFFDEYESVMEEGETILRLAEETYGSTCTANALLAVDALLLSPGDQVFVSRGHRLGKGRRCRDSRVQLHGA